MVITMARTKKAQKSAEIPVATAKQQPQAAPAIPDHVLFTIAARSPAFFSDTVAIRGSDIPHRYLAFLRPDGEQQAQEIRAILRQGPNL